MNAELDSAIARWIRYLNARDREAMDAATEEINTILGTPASVRASRVTALLDALPEHKRAAWDKVVKELDSALLNVAANAIGEIVHTWEEERRRRLN